MDRRGSNRSSLQIFLVISTCFLYLVAAGLFSRAVWYLEADAVGCPAKAGLATEADITQWNRIAGGEAAESGSGPGSYDIRKSVWHVNVSVSMEPADVFVARLHGAND